MEQQKNYVDRRSGRNRRCENDVNYQALVERRLKERRTFNRRKNGERVKSWIVLS